MIEISADSLNLGCVCRSLDPERLRRELDGEPFLAGFADDVAQSSNSIINGTCNRLSCIEHFFRE